MHCSNNQRIFRIEEVPGSGLERTELGVFTNRGGHPLAERLDVSKTGGETHGKLEL
eukprot:SAG31_NODE_22554_length_524_cov_0.693396_1_plen_56_part_00